MAVRPSGPVPGGPHAAFRRGSTRVMLMTFASPPRTSPHNGRTSHAEKIFRHRPRPRRHRRPPAPRHRTRRGPRRQPGRPAAAEPRPPERHPGRDRGRRPDPRRLPDPADQGGAHPGRARPLGGVPGPGDRLLVRPRRHPLRPLGPGRRPQPGHPRRRTRHPHRRHRPHRPGHRGAQLPHRRRPVLHPRDAERPAHPGPGGPALVGRGRRHRPRLRDRRQHRGPARQPAARLPGGPDGVPLLHRHRLRHRLPHGADRRLGLLQRLADLLAGLLPARLADPAEGVRGPSATRKALSPTRASGW